MRLLNALRRIILLLLAIPVVIICLHALLRALGAQRQNPIVSAIRGARDQFVLPVFRTVFAGRSPLRDEIVTLVAIGVVALAVVFLFRALASMVGTRPPRTRPAPATTKKAVASETTTTKTTKTEPAAAPAAAPARASDATSHDGDHGDHEAHPDPPVTSATKKTPKDTQSTSG